ncbi:MAG: hypothetical protein U1E05_14905, partial [Patescibacteria group bacterium]|nr:hypothetical protein [Patescibacteria group bacterium]
MQTSISGALRRASLLTLTVALCGCLPVEVVDDPGSQPVETEIPAVAEQSPAVAKPPEAVEPELPPPPPTIPKVNLTESLNATCLIGVGDSIPEGELPDLEGKPHAIRDSLGEKLTVL